MSSWIVRQHPNPETRLRLFCLPHAGGGASAFGKWSTALPRDVEICAVQLPGRENRLLEPPFDRLSLLIPTLADILDPYLTLPFAFFGHSMGALAGFELCRYLRSQSGPLPAQLFVSGYRAPHLPRRVPPRYALPDPRFMDELRRLNGTPPEVLEHAELMQLVMPTLRADFALCETYVYSEGRKLDLPISAFGGLHDHEVSAADLSAWNEHTRASFTLRLFPGNHFYIVTAQRDLLQSIAEDLMQPATQT